MGNKLETAPEEHIRKRKCCHYWVIETPEGPTSKGVCKLCGAEKDFDSFGPDSWSLWERNKSTSDEFFDSGFSDVVPVKEQDDS